MNDSYSTAPGGIHEIDTRPPGAGELKAFGFWLYLMSDLVLFAALFATYAVVGGNTAGGPGGNVLFDLKYTFAETTLLLLSSTTCGIAIWAMHEGRRQVMTRWLVLTLFLGLGFLGMEVKEFADLLAAGHGPGRSAFLSAFFTLVGTHGLHVLGGSVWLAVLLVQVGARGLTAPVRSRLMRLSMFWHFLDIVWVGVFTIVYLMGVM